MGLLGIETQELKKIGGYNTCFEMVNQLNLWNQGVNIIKENQHRIKTFLNNVLAVEDLKIYLVGAGSSAKAASIVENYIKKITGKEVKAIPSTSLITHEDYFIDKSPALLVSLGSSGNTTEALEAVKIFKKKSIKLYQMLIICSSKGSIVRENADTEDVLYIPIPEDTKGKSFAATGEFTILVQYALMLFDIERINYYEEMFNNIIAQGKEFLDNEANKIHEISKRHYDSIVALGSNSLTYLASEMGLKVNELSAGKQNTQFNSILEFRHGPKLVLNSNALITFLFSQDEHALKYELDMLKECYDDKRQSTIIAVSINFNEEIEDNCDYYFYFNKSDINKFNYLDDSHIIFLYSLYLQSIAILKSIYMSMSPDMPDSSGTVNKVAQGVKVYKRKL